MRIFKKCKLCAAAAAVVGAMAMAGAAVIIAKVVENRKKYCEELIPIIGDETATNVKVNDKGPSKLEHKETKDGDDNANN